jgi:hypothetical protein
MATDGFHHVHIVPIFYAHFSFTPIILLSFLYYIHTHFILLSIFSPIMVLLSFS